MPELVFPKSSSGRTLPGQGEGRLINVCTTLEGETAVLIPAPGLVSWGTVGPMPRGMMADGSTVYVAVSGSLYTIGLGGLATLAGALVGDENVTMARNNRDPIADRVVVTDTGAFVMTPSSVMPYPDADVGNPNSVSFLDAYFLFTYGDGTIRASELNSTAISTISNVKAEAKPDGLLRSVVKDRQFIAFGPGSTEFYSNAGTQPFPLARDEVRDVGLFGRWAVAGHESGWDRPLFMVAADGSVRRWDGYTATRVSTNAVERDILAVQNRDRVEACVYTFGGTGVLSISGPKFTWDLHVDSGQWFERRSYGLDRWRASKSAYAFNRWLVGDIASNQVLAVQASARTELADPVVCSAEGMAMAKARLSRLSLRFSTGQGREGAVSVPEEDPRVMIDCSLDGGASYGSKVERSLGRQGEYSRQIKVTSLGRSPMHPARVRWTVSDPVSFQFLGGSVEAR